MMMTRAQGGVQLPAGYTPLEYIETDGNSYIDTFYNPNQNTRVVMKVSGFPNTSNAVLFGARTSYISSDKFAFIASGNSVYRASFYNKDIELAASISYSGEMVVDQNKNTTYLNGSAVATAPTGAFSCPYTLHLFSFNNGGAPSGYCKVKFYYCQIYDNGTLVRDFIPAMNASGEAGLYDLKNDVWYALKPVETKKENKISVRQDHFEDRFGREGFGYGFIAQYSLASDVTIYYKGDNYSLDSQFSGSFIMNKGSSSAYNVVTNVLDVGLGIVGKSINAITSISPTEDDTYIYTF